MKYNSLKYILQKGGTTADQYFLVNMSHTDFEDYFQTCKLKFTKKIYPSTQLNNNPIPRFLIKEDDKLYHHVKEQTDIELVLNPDWFEDIDFIYILQYPIYNIEHCHNNNYH